MAVTAVIVVNYNGREHLGRCLASVLRQTPPPSEVLVIDNASEDGSVDALPPGVALVRLPANRGFAGAVNVGLQRTSAPFVLTLNPDVELLPGCLAAAAEALAADAGLGSVAPRVLMAAEPGRIDASGLGLTSSFGQINCEHGLREGEAAAEARVVLGPLGGVALWRRAALDAVGGWCEAYFLYWEDFDLALRLAAAGHSCRSVPAARALHVGGGSIGRHSAANVFYMVRNHWACLLACLPADLARRRWWAVTLAPLRAASLYAARGQPLAALWGLMCAPTLLPGALRRRRQLPRVAAGATAAAVAARLPALLSAADAERLLLKAHALR
jgi:GT2 family glycosyltransferase